jgi:hypothetical protein
MATRIELIEEDLIPLVDATLAEARRLTDAVEGLHNHLQTLTAALHTSELRDTTRLLGILLSQLGCPYERR